MANKLLSGQPFRPRASKPYAKATSLLRLRPIDGGLQLDNTGEFVPKNKASAMRDVLFYKNELRKSPGGVLYGTFEEAIAWCGVWNRLSEILVPVVLTTRNLYYYLNGVWNKVAPYDSISGTTFERASVVFLDDKMYFTSYDYELRQWNGVSNHSRVNDGFSARTMDVFNNRILLGHTIENGESRSQTVRFTQNGVVKFTGTGSGGLELNDRDDHIVKIKKLGPFRGIVYKDGSMYELRATGDVDFPFQPSEIAPIGVYCPNSVIEYPRGHMFLGSDRQVWTYGNSLEEVGDEVYQELFDQINLNARNKAIGYYDAIEKECIFLIPTGTTASDEPSVYYAYNTNRKRWRSGVYEGVTSINRHKTMIGISWDEDQGNWDSATDTWNDEADLQTEEKTIVGTVDKKVFLLDKEVFVFNSKNIDFQYVTGDLISEIDGGEVTLMEIIVGYIVDGVASLEISASVDRGETFTGLKTVQLGGALKKPNAVAYARASFLLTAESIRVKLRNANAGEKVRIVSISARIGDSKVSRAEALQ